MANGQTRACSSHQLGFTCLSLLSLSLLPSPGMLQPEVPTFWRKDYLQLLQTAHHTYEYIWLQPSGGSFERTIDSTLTIVINFGLLNR
jgi:hypothetical protein